MTQSCTVRLGDHGDLWEGLFFSFPKEAVLGDVSPPSDIDAMSICGITVATLQT